MRAVAILLTLTLLATFIISQDISPASLAAPLSSQSEIRTGKVIESVVTSRDPSQSYALYLPSNYTPEKSWPLLLCLDPRARGAIPVKLFSEAAERYGWIVIGSNNSRNGPLKPSLEAVSAIHSDAQAFEKGFKDVDAITKEPAFDPLRSDREFQTLVSSR
jgi:hypothetical protein